MGELFYNLGKMAGPHIRKIKWIWQSAIGTEAHAIQKEYEVGQDLACEIRLQLEPEPNIETAQLLNKVGNSLSACVTNKLRKFSFEAVKGVEPNAFALPGGFIFVTTSMLELCECDQGELAFILGHEMGHIIRGHAINRIITNSAIAAGAKVTSAKNFLLDWLGKVGIKFLESAYSQDLEMEADTLGVRLVTVAGYNPRAPRKLFLRLSNLIRSSKRSGLENYFSSHPPFDIRIRNIDRLTSEI